MSNNNEMGQQNDINESSLSESRSRKPWKCLSRESLTCLMLSGIVIGLPIAIIIILMNLPKLSTRGDTRQQHYILLAFGFPFSLVFIVSVLYGSFRAIMYCYKGSDQSRHLQSRMSWRHFSRRLRSRRHLQRDNDFDTELSAENRFYSLVNQVMAQNTTQVFPQTIDATLPHINEPYIQTPTLLPFTDNHIKQMHSISYE